MTSRFTGKNLKTNHMLILELLHFLKKLNFQHYVSNTPAALACSSIDNTAMLYGFYSLDTHCTLKFKCFQNLNSLHEIHVRGIRKETHRSV